jgi:hypothetical protein
MLNNSKNKRIIGGKVQQYMLFLRGFKKAYVSVRKEV